jgi:hypothetical protein
VSVLKPGQTFGSDLRIKKLISRGGMGEVYLATREGISGFRRDVVLKTILPSLADHDNFIALFLSEARIAARLDHRNIVSAHACGRTGDLLWIEQSYVRGLNLRDLIKEAGRLPMGLAAFIVGEVLSALDYAYDRPGADGQPLRVVHRDIKPANIMVSHEGEIKLTDFGIAKALGETHATKTGTIRGSAGYIAPEVLASEEATTRSDLFCVGLVFWETFTGRALFDGADEKTRLLKTVECNVPPLPLPVPADLEAWLRRLLARDPLARYATPGEALRDLRALPTIRDVAAPELRAFVDTVAPMTIERGAAPAGVEDGVPVEILDDAAEALRVGTGTKTMAGEVIAPAAAGRARRFLRSRGGKVGALTVLVASASVGILLGLPTVTHAPAHLGTVKISTPHEEQRIQSTAVAQPALNIRVIDVPDAAPAIGDIGKATLAAPDAAPPSNPPANESTKTQHHRRRPQQGPHTEPGSLTEDYVAPPPKD